MNKTLSKLLPGTALMGVLLLSSGAWSMGPAPEHDMGRVLEHMADELDLSESQEEKIETLMNESRDAGREDQQRLSELRTELREMRSDFDAGRAQQLADEMGEVTSRIAYRMASTHAQIYEQLDAEQREEFEAMAERREKRFEKRVAKYRR